MPTTNSTDKVRVQLEVEMEVSKIVENPKVIEKEFLKDVFGKIEGPVKVSIVGESNAEFKIRTPQHRYWLPIDIMVSKDAVSGVKYKLRGQPWKDDKSASEFLNGNYMIVPDVEADDCPVCGESLTKGNTHHGVCKTCFMKEHFNILSYSHKPTPNFKTIDGETTTKFYGLEIELSVNNKDKFAEFHYNHPEVYFKSDSSIPAGKHGAAEVVSHPLSFNALMDKGSFIHNMPKATNGSGCHIHISREAFKDDTHFALWYFLTLKSNRLLDTVARRPENGYCQRRLYEDVTTKKNTKKSGQDRVAINERNDNTVELRIFNWSVDPKVLRSYVQFIDSMIEYTRSKKRTVTVTYWKKFVASKPEYADLYAIIKDMTFPLGESSVTRSEPRYREVLLRNLTLNHLRRGAYYVGRDGRELKIIGTDVSSENRVYFAGGGSVDLTPEAVIKVRVN